MVSPSTLKNENANDLLGNVLNASKNAVKSALKRPYSITLKFILGFGRAAVGRSPLQGLKFYLDLRNVQTATKIESKIKELGGSLEVFLIKEVTHVVTDNKDWYYNKSKDYNLINAAAKSSTAKSFHKTRTDAMLERVRCKNATDAKNPLQQAKQWGIIIWSVEKAIAWLDKIAIAALSQLKKKSKVYELKTPHIKFESYDRQTKPILQELCVWPVFNTSGVVGDPAFAYRSRAERNMTRKTRSHHPCIDPGLQPGYCEVCRVDYLKFFTHIQSEKHLSFINDDTNYVSLDSLIDEKSSFNTFLKIHGDTNSDTCIEAEYHPKVISGKMSRTPSRSFSERCKNSPNSVGRSDSERRLRSRKPLNYFANDDNLPSRSDCTKSVRELRSSSHFRNHQVEHTQEVWNSGRPKRSTCTRKRSTADERLVSDNRNYYKVEVMTNKLRSSGLSPQDRELIKRLHTSVVEKMPEEEKCKGLVVKFHRLRTSELMRLNNEAENFLFPKKEHSDEDPDVNGPNTTATSGNHSSTLLLSSEPEQKRKRIKVEDEASMDSSCSETTSVSRRKRRRTHAEAFITDNEKYYKFETPGSRLRYHGSLLPPIADNLPRNNGDCVAKNIKAEITKVEEQEPEYNESIVNLDELQFSFERVPRSEPWYQTFQRQDRGEEYYTCFSDSGYFKPFLLPYEMGSLPPLNPKICISAYNDAKKVLMEPPSASTSAGCNTPDPSLNSMQSEVEACDINDEDSKISVDSINESNSDEQKNKMDDQTYSGKRKRRKSFLMNSKNSRKSPRQHASTLAILSSFIQQRKRKEKVRSSELNYTKVSLPSILEESKECNEEVNDDADYDTISKKINDFLNVSEDDLYELDVPNNQSIDLNCKLSAVELLAVLDNKHQDENCSSSPRLNGYSARRLGKKKKKKNRTGWPNKNRKSRRDLNIKEEPEDYNADSPSINIDSEFCSEDYLELTDSLSIINNINTPNFVNMNCVKPANKNKKNHLENIYKNQSVDHCFIHSSDRSDRVENEVAEKDKRDSVNVDLEKWENAEKILQAKITNSECIDKDLTLQPFVRVQKLDSEIAFKHGRTRGSGSRRSNSKRPRLQSSPKSPKNLRKPRGRWYRER